MNTSVSDIAFDSTNNVLYAGGLFTDAGGVTVNYIAKWNGTTWSALGTGMNSSVNALAFDSTNNVLYVGGNFTTAGGVTVNRIVKYTNSSYVLNTDISKLYLTYNGTSSMSNLLYYNDNTELYSQVN